MYKPLLLSLLSVTLTTAAFAQQDSTRTSTGFSKNNFYVRGGVGYATPQGASGVDYSLSSYKVKNMSFASGLNATIGVGYNINDYIGVELAGSMFSANKKNTFGENNFNYTLNYNSINEVSANVQSLVLLMPGLVLHTAPARLSAYTRLSVVLPVVNNYSYTTYDPVNLSSETIKYKSHIALGFSAAAGLTYKINPRISVWAEASAMSLAPTVKKTTVTSYSVNGVDKLNTIAPQSTSYALSGTYGNNYSATAGTQTTFGTAPTFTNNFSNIGCQAGISVNIGKKSESPIHLQPLQKHWYVKAGVGYALPAFSNYSSSAFNGSSQSLSTASSNGTNTQTINYSNKTYSFSKGISGTIAAGYMLSRHFGFELDADLQLTHANYTYTYYSRSVGYTYPSDEYTHVSSHAKMPGFLIPSFVMQTGGSVVNIYSRIGLALPGSNKRYETVTYTGATAINSTDATYTMKFTMGYTAAAGVSYNLTKRLKLWGEISALSYAPNTKQENYVTSSGTAGGVPQQYNFHTSGTNNYNSGNPNFNDQPTFKSAYSNIGAKLGVAFEL